MRRGSRLRSLYPSSNYSATILRNMSIRLPRSIVASVLAMTAASAVLVAQSVKLQDTLPFDAAVRTAKLPNGLTYFIRANTRPAQRVSLRLAVKAGSLFEGDDQLGLAHLVGDIAVYGRGHF